MAGWCKAVIDQWLFKSGITEGQIIRQCSWKKNYWPLVGDIEFPVIGDSLSTTSIYNAVGRYSMAALGRMIAPHDLRRSFAKIGS